MNQVINPPEIEARRQATILIFAVFSAQLATAVVVDNLHEITKYSSGYRILYYLLTLLAAIPQSGLSDDCGRKKHLLIASVSVSLSLLFFLIAFIFGIQSLGLSDFLAALLAAFPACFTLGIMGNVIPIARGCLTNLGMHDFRTAIGLTTVVIGLGWVTENFLGFILPPVGVIIISLCLQVLITIFIFKFYRPTNEATSHSITFLQAGRNSFLWLIRISSVVGGIAAVTAYFLSETVFYQIYTIDESPLLPIGKKVLGVLMGAGYLLGVSVQSIVYPSDRKSIKFGVVFSFIFMVVILLEEAFSTKNIFILSIRGYGLEIEGVAQFLFAFGAGFIVPSLFSLMSTKIHKNHTGKLFGVVDTTDTLALWLSSFLEWLKRTPLINNNLISSISLVLFTISAIIYFYFTRLFKSYEHFPKNRAKKDK